MTRIGLPLEAVLYITKASPGDMTWLTAEAAKTVGIALTVAELQKPEAKSIEPPKPVSAPKEVSVTAPQERGLLDKRPYRSNSFWKTYFT